MERRLAVHARSTRHALTACVAIGALFASAPALAAPRSKGAKAAFDRGVAAYEQSDYAGAARALRQSFDLEPDVETLFAWAQAERQQDRCDNAIALYNKLLAFDLPAENRQVVLTKLDECTAIIAAAAPPAEAPVGPAVAPA
ncbi:MAG: hypothetical protein M3680_16340, partial [Myxococcota bacterium]|nr:hypothetical protein [Myxococcota bacterium]